MLEIAMNQINVTNLEEAIAWYTEVLGFELSKEHYYPPQAVDLIQNGGIRLLLYRVQKNTKIDYPNQAQSLIIFRTTNLKHMIKELTNKGVEFLYSEVKKFPAGIFTAFKDPFGNVHEIVEFH
ncbi:MAG: VOC family protein [Candidatus Thorarchaeota archaeon]